LKLGSNNVYKSNNGSTEEAKIFQGPESNSVYFGKDEWRRGNSLKVGDIIVQTEWRDKARIEKMQNKNANEPAGSFFSQKSEVEKARDHNGHINARTFSESVQVAPRADHVSGKHVYNKYISFYKVVKVPPDYSESTVRRNNHLGDGGAKQFYFKDHENLEKHGYLEYIKHNQTVKQDHALPQYAVLDNNIDSLDYDSSVISENKKAYDLKSSQRISGENRTNRRESSTNKTMSNEKIEIRLSRSERIMQKRQKYQSMGTTGVSVKKGIRIKP